MERLAPGLFIISSTNLNHSGWILAHQFTIMVSRSWAWLVVLEVFIVICEMLISLLSRQWLKKSLTSLKNYRHDYFDIVIVLNSKLSFSTHSLACLFLRATIWDVRLAFETFFSTIIWDAREEGEFFRLCRVGLEGPRPGELGEIDFFYTLPFIVLLIITSSKL